MNSNDIMYGVRNAAGEWLCHVGGSTLIPFWDCRARLASWYTTHNMAGAARRDSEEVAARIVTVKVVET